METTANWIPSFTAISRASIKLWSEEYGPGMATPVTFSRPTASTAIAAVSDESMPPLKPMSTREKPHLRL
jgi:hypothetical protein